MVSKSEIGDKVYVNRKCAVLFFMQKLRCKGGKIMFSDEILEKIFAQKEIQKVPFVYQSTVIHVIERVLEEMGVKVNDAVSKFES